MKRSRYLQFGFFSLMMFALVSSMSVAMAEGRALIKPIKFARGASSALVKGTLSGFGSEQVYSIAVRQGQVMRVEQLNSGHQPTSLWLTDPQGEDASDADLSCNNKKRVSPTLAGTYIIRVSECMKADPWKGTYVLKITVK